MIIWYYGIMKFWRYFIFVTYFIILYCSILYHTILYYTILCYLLLYYTIRSKLIWANIKGFAQHAPPVGKLLRKRWLATGAHARYPWPQCMWTFYEGGIASRCETKKKHILITWTKHEPFCNLRTPFDVVFNAFFYHGSHSTRPLRKPGVFQNWSYLRPQKVPWDDL